MTKTQFAKLVEAWGGDEETARKLHIKPRTVKAFRLGERKIRPTLAAFIALLQSTQGE